MPSPYLLYILIGVILLVIASYFTCLSYALSEKSHKELQKNFSLPRQDTHLNLSFIVTDIPIAAYRILGGGIVCIILLFLASHSLPPAPTVWIGVILGIYAIGSFLFFLNIRWATKANTKRKRGKILMGLYSILKFGVPQNIKKFTVEDTSTIRANTKENAKEDMLKSILQFGRETAKDIMTSRMDIIALDIKTPFSEVVKLIAENSYSRVPIYSETKDNVVGILYIKDLLPYLNKSDKFRWSSLLRPQLCIPETKKIDNLFREFQTRKIHIAIVIDEYGGVAGLVTLEDIIEEIVGEIHDEYDDDSNPYVTLGTNTYVFDAKISLQNFEKLFNLNDTFFKDVEGDADTLAGFLIELIDSIPQKHQIVEFRQFRFEILGIDERHISKVKVSISPTAQ